MIDLHITDNLDNMDNIFKKLLLFSHTMHTDYRFPSFHSFQFSKTSLFFSDQFFSLPLVSRKEPTSQGYQPNMTQKDIIKPGKKFHIKAGENILINENA